MGARYARMVADRRVPGLRLAAVCNRSPEPRAAFPDVPGFADSRELIRSGLVDSVLVVTPHLSHAGIGIDALRHGLHLLVDKPLAAHVAEARRLIAAPRDPRQVFAVLFQMRTDPRYRLVRAWIRSGRLGRILRFQWTITDWFRPDSYYRSSAWRGTWRGEGGGVLLNQAPHQLDLLQWLFGMPATVRAWCGLGRHHPIEVEDAVTARLAYRDGMEGVFIASTGEAPGTNRLEIATDRGRVVIEGSCVSWDRTAVPVSAFRARSTNAFGAPKVTRVEKRFDLPADLRPAVLRDFARAIRLGRQPLAPGAEGLASLELANAMLQSSFEEREIRLPLNAVRYARLLARLQRPS
jgi:predicted dehydrogenase